MPRNLLRVDRFAQIRRAEIGFGDLTVLIGPQATGKSMVLQLLKLALDAGNIARTLRDRGFEWKDRNEFCSVYFGEGMAEAWTDHTAVTLDGRRVHAPPAKATRGASQLFYIPAHRTLSVAEGWPAGFRSYKPDTPFVVRDFSERLLELLTTKRGTQGEQIFPQERRLKQQFRTLIDEAVFHGGKLKLLSDGPRRQFKLVYPHAEIAYMAWTAGQREFIPLLLGIYHLVPLGPHRKVTGLRWIVIEEPEMGLHPKAIRAVMLLILELLDRGYRVALSTHSSAVVEIIWGLQVLKARGAGPAAVTKMFDLEGSRWDIGELARSILRKRYRVYYLDYEGRKVASHDISDLDPASPAAAERTWGELTRLSERVNATVAEATEDASEDAP